MDFELSFKCSIVRNMLIIDFYLRLLFTADFINDILNCYFNIIIMCNFQVRIFISM